MGNEQQARLVELLSQMTTSEGLHPTQLPGVNFMRADHHYPRQPVMYEASICIIAQGRKRGYLGGGVYTYDPHHYLVLSLPLPFECETEPGPDGPLLGVSVQVDLAVLGELLMRCEHRPVDPDAVVRAIYSTPIDAALGGAAVRLLECLANPADTAVLGPQIVREITWRVLCGPNGDCLRALAAVHGRIGQIHRALQRLHMRYAEPVDVASLAKDVAMSPSAFHHHFKSVTATSPLQYLKTIRLHKARMLMAHDGMGAAVAAARVGYESASQFSREFKRFFGASPLAEASRVRQMLGLEAPLAPHRPARDSSRDARSGQPHGLGPLGPEAL